MIDNFKYISKSIKKFEGTEWGISVLKYDHDKYNNIDLGLFKYIDKNLYNVYSCIVTRIYDSNVFYHILEVNYGIDDALGVCYIDLEYIDNLLRIKKLERILEE